MFMKTIGILTLSASDNCGSLLQTYALQRVIEDLGHSVSVINFDSPQSREMYNVLPPNPLKHPKRLVQSLFRLQRLKKQKADYNRFRKTYLRLTDEVFLGLDNVRKADGKYDYIVVGSDQVWNIRMSDFDESFLLGWVQKSKKIAYAPSLGGSDFSQYSDKEQLKKFLLSYQALSTREKKGQKAVFDITGRNIPVLADPTLLLAQEEWNRLAETPLVEGEYVFYYSWAYNNQKLNNIVSEYAQRNHLPVYVINASKWLKRNPKQYGFTLAADGGPSAFLKLMRYARTVFVESFHGVVFANIYEKDFYFLDDHSDDVIDPRLDSILTLFGRKDRVVRKLEDITGEVIDYSAARTEKEQLVKQSIDYLKEQLR